ncbi:MAG: efflux RND transporter periplasmic adaptor subunit [Defluviitaleaceae bacterium]|nr:efflux RND transporter periplasmic adaptor subunit [Defluviitaleaceae bacterium]
MKSKLNMLALVMVLMLAVLSITGCNESLAEEQEVFVPVEIFEVVPDSIRTEIMYSGRISAYESVLVISRLAGQVVETYFNVGDVVRRDDILFRLDEQDIENQVRALESQLGMAGQGVRAAESALRQVTGGQFQSTILQLEGAVMAAEVQLENVTIGLQSARDAYANMSTSFESARVLYEAGAMSRNDFERAEIGYNQAANAVLQATLGLSQAESGLEMARDAHRIAVNQISQENTERARIGVSQAAFSQEAAQVALEIALDALDDTAVRSPISGIVSARNARVGEFISPQVPAFNIVNMDTVTVDVRVSEVIINRIAQGDDVNVHIQSISDEPITGTIKTVSPAADHTNLFPVQIEIDNRDGIIRPGMFAEVRFTRESAEDAIVLPRSAVMRDDTSFFVFVNENGFARRARVETGIDNGAFIQVISGVDLNSQVIVAGQDFLSDGTEILVTAVRGR